MTYFQFLLYFILFPLLLLVWIQRRKLECRQVGAMAILSLIALFYTTLWDNYLVANRIWWYDPDRVAGLTLGWVPIEEYLFFILQPVLVGSWFFLLQRAIPAGTNTGPVSARWFLPLPLGILWLLSAWILVLGWSPGRYLALELIWALPPVMLQLFFGGDILWRAWKSIAISIFSAAIYLSAVDWIAIREGIWTISPADTTGLLLGGVLPVEEAVFFLLTCILIVFGIALAISPEARDRLVGWFGRLRGREEVAVR